MSVRDEGQTLSHLISSLGDQILQQDIPEEGQKEIQLVLKDCSDCWEVFERRYISAEDRMDVSTHPSNTEKAPRQINSLHCPYLTYKLRLSASFAEFFRTSTMYTKCLKYLNYTLFSCLHLFNSKLKQIHKLAKMNLFRFRFLVHTIESLHSFFNPLIKLG